MFDAEGALCSLDHGRARLRRLHKKGVLAAGMDADLVVLDGGNIIRDVMAGGAWHRQHGKQLLKGRYESE